MKFYEKKDNLIRKNPNLTEEQKQEIIALLAEHPSSENLIDWNKNNKLTYEDFLNVLRPLYINDLDFRGLIEGEDYDLLLDKPKEKLYAIYTHNASKILASNAVAPKMWTKIPDWCGREEFTDEAHAFGHFDSEHGDMKPGAKWCISMQTSDRYWNQYSPNYHFLFWFRNSNRFRNNKKIAIGVSKSTWKVALIYNGADKDTKMELPSYITEAIENEGKAYKEKELNWLKSKLKLNPQTNRYDYDGDLYRDELINFVSENRDGFLVNFGKITGNFDCSGLNLTSLKGAPIEVGGWFGCNNNRFTSLKGAPQIVGEYFTCQNNQLTSLEGAPKTVGGIFSCSYNKLTSLRGAPIEVGEGFSCSHNQLTSLEGAPTEVGEGFYCNSNLLTSLKGAPKKVGKSFDCRSNYLISLEGAPQKVGESFDCSYNQLTSLEGAPTEVDGFFDCKRNQLTSLKGAPQTVGWDFYCSINCLTSLEGAPQKVGRDFYCHSNPSLHSLDGIGEVKRFIYKDF